MAFTRSLYIDYGQTRQFVPCDPDRYTREEVENDWRYLLYQLIKKFFSSTTEIFDPALLPEFCDYCNGNTSTLMINAESILTHLNRDLGFNYENPELLISYLLKNPSLIDVFFYASLLTFEEFRNDEINVKINGESNHPWSYLQITIRQREYDNNIMERIDKICNQFEPEIGSNNGYILLTTDFYSPIA